MYSYTCVYIVYLSSALTVLLQNIYLYTNFYLTVHDHQTHEETRHFSTLTEAITPEKMLTLKTTHIHHSLQVLPGEQGE